MKIEIMGSGCAKCNKLYEAVKKVVSEERIEASIVKVEDIKKIMEAGVFMTPALVIDGQVKLSGKVPGADKLKELIAGK